MESDSAELYDPATSSFSATGSMTTWRSSHTATLLSDGRVLIAGGNGGGASAELYDPATGTFRATASMATAREWRTATLLSDGKVLVAGGWATYGTIHLLVSAELYDPATDTFNITGSMATGHYGHTATLLSDGTVLVVGGCGGGDSAELYTR